MILEAIPNIINAVSERVIEKLRRQLALSRKGNEPMNTTNRLSNSLKAIGEPGLLCDIEIAGEDYGAVLDKGTSKSLFEWSGRGAEPGSPYIHGLVAWLGAKKGLFGKPALQAAFRIARVQKANAKAPKNPGWVKEIKNDLNKEVGQDLHNTVFATIELDINTSILNRTI